MSNPDAIIVYSPLITVVQERSQTYERVLREKSQVIRDTELRSMNRKERSVYIHNQVSFWSLNSSLIDLQSFREALAILQHQVDELDKLRISHYEEIIEHEEEVWDVVQGKVSSCARVVSFPLMTFLHQGLCGGPVNYGRFR